jgi:hypothetical protein
LLPCLTMEAPIRLALFALRRYVDLETSLSVSGKPKSRKLVPYGAAHTRARK